MVCSTGTKLETLLHARDILPAHSNFLSAYFCILAAQSPYLNTFPINNDTNFLKVRDFRHAVAQSGARICLCKKQSFQSGTCICSDST